MKSVSGNRLAGDALREVLRTFGAELAAAVHAGDVDLFVLAGKPTEKTQ